MKIKFCGIRRLEDVAAVNLCQPDYMGMILSGGFRRSISQVSLKPLSGVAGWPFTSRNCRGERVNAASPADGSSEKLLHTRKP